jgi:mannose-6-phosphate isomerase
MLYPLTFHPIFMERVWGGRKLAELYGKRLPADLPIGESWEICDRPGAVSVIANGAHAGKDLHWAVREFGASLLGDASAPNGRFPLLIKLLDAQEKLSLQVHPPPAKAAELAGEPKTEVWYIAEAAPGATLYAGLKKGVTRGEFETRIRDGTVDECLHQVHVAQGDSMFLPSGRVHAIGAGLVICEVQQNSDTTYRVFDWNRVGLDGKPRSLHIRESLASIDFNDFEPMLIRGVFYRVDSANVRPLVDTPLFTVSAFQAIVGAEHLWKTGRMRVLGVLTGRLRLFWDKGELLLAAGQFCLIPAAMKQLILRSETTSTFLDIQAGIA